MTGNARSSGYDLAEDSWYQEGREAIDMLLDKEPFIDFGPIWDPACGEGNIPIACQARGIDAFGSDLVDRGSGVSGMDFLKLEGKFLGSIICNPPFDLIEPFIHQALKMATYKVAMIGRLAFLEGQARRDSLWHATPISRVWVFSKRISMPPGGRGIKPTGGSIAFAWYVWDNYETPDSPRIGWL